MLDQRIRRGPAVATASEPMPRQRETDATKVSGEIIFVLIVTLAKPFNPIQPSPLPGRTTSMSYARTEPAPEADYGNPWSYQRTGSVF